MSLEGVIIGEYLASDGDAGTGWRGSNHEWQKTTGEQYWVGCDRKYVLTLI